MEWSREQVLRYRMYQQGLFRLGDDTRIFELGVQYVAAGIEQALAARVSEIPYDTRGLTLGWTYRGAPHLHRDGDIERLAAALLPAKEDDARAKLAWSRPAVERCGMPAERAVRTVASAARKAITEPMSKGAASAAITRLIPRGLTRDCRACHAVHVNEQLMRIAMLPAGILLDRDERSLVLYPRKPWTIPRRSDPEPAIRAYLEFLGPAGSKDVAAFLGTTEAELAEHWPSDLIECTVAGKTAYLTAEPSRAPADRIVRLLPPMDPYLQARDRDLLVPDKAAQREIWRSIGYQGAVLVDGELLGTWRTKTAGSRIHVTVAPFAPLDTATRAAIDAEATRLAELRNATDLDLTIG